jgi:hypothetical protein
MYLGTSIVQKIVQGQISHDYKSGYSWYSLHHSLIFQLFAFILLNTREKYTERR